MSTAVYLGHLLSRSILWPTNRPGLSTCLMDPQTLGMVRRCHNPQPPNPKGDRWFVSCGSTLFFIRTFGPFCASQLVANRPHLLCPPPLSSHSYLPSSRFFFALLHRPRCVSVNLACNGVSNQGPLNWTSGTVGGLARLAPGQSVLRHVRLLHIE